jgi:hypothetical protein
MKLTMIFFLIRRRRHCFVVCLSFCIRLLVCRFVFVWFDYIRFVCFSRGKEDMSNRIWLIPKRLWRTREIKRPGTLDKTSISCCAVKRGAENGNLATASVKYMVGRTTILTRSQSGFRFMSLSTR